jgi:hypothetical protein
MEAQITNLLRRPATTAARSCSSFTALVLPNRTSQQIRQKSTVNRHKRALGVPPHPSFLTSPSKPSSGHIIYNPPSSEPNVLHTPFKFLPKSDPRRKANLPALFASVAPPAEKTPLPPMLPFLPGPNKPKIHHLTPDDVSEIRRLRSEDPVTNSVGNLAKKFGCSHLFIQMCTHAPKEHQEAHKARLAAIRARWGPIRAKAREDRARRRQMLLRGEI